MEYHIDSFINNLAGLKEQPSEKQELAMFLEFVLNTTTWSTDTVSQFSMQIIDQAIDLLENYDCYSPDHNSLLTQLFLVQKCKEILPAMQTKHALNSKNFF